MFRFSHKTLIIFSGMIWLSVGAILLPLGLHFIVDSTRKSLFLYQNSFPLLEYFSRWTGGVEQAAFCMVVIGLLLGYLKGRLILSKSVKRLVRRIRSYPDPVSIAKIYPLSYFALLCGMLLIGIGIKYLGVPYDIRGMIDVAIGAALINGAMFYFRDAFTREPMHAR